MQTKIACLLLCGVIAPILALVLTRESGTLISLREPGAVDSLPLTAIFNPMRNKDPEKAAGRFLALLRQGERQETLDPMFLDQGRLRFLVEKEEMWPIEGWRLRGRQTVGEGADSWLAPNDDLWR